MFVGTQPSRLYNEETGKNAWKPVVRLFRNQTKEWYHVFVDSEEIVCTREHPFYVVGKGFVPAKGLKPKDKLVLANGEQVKIDKIEIERLVEPETTYNFEVADFHTYYVTETNVLVHNKCKQQLVAGNKDDWNATVSIGGEPNHQGGHAHINKKRLKLASVDSKGEVLVISRGIKTSDKKKLLGFVKDNLDDIAKGIEEWYY